ncbi:MAG: MFS transporter, partial [Deltaproteobacteria bacterium]|nr:MFS transporter [Deltaproteobacteria bacterium]
MAQRADALSLAAGWLVILLISLALYDGLLYDGLRREIRSQTLSLASMSASTLNIKIATGLRLGKDLRRFMGIERLLAQAAENLPPGGGLAVLGPEAITAALGDVDGLHMPGPWNSADPVITQQAGKLDLYLPITQKNGDIVGCTAVRLSTAYFTTTALPLLRRVILPQAGIAAAALALLLLLLFRGPFAHPARHGRLPTLCLGLFLLVMGISAVHSMRVYLDYYTRASRSLALNAGRALSGDLNKLLLVGVSLDNMANLDQYLRTISANTPDQSVMLNLLDPREQVTASSHPQATETAEDLSLRLPLSARMDGPSGSNAAFQGWAVSVGVTRTAYLNGLRALALNVATLVVIALMFMIENFSLVIHYSAAARPVPGEARRTVPLLRALLFLGVMGVDMSISFIPLRMEEFAGRGAMHPALMGLPVSMEIFLAGIGIFAAGVWTKRRGPVPPMTCGFCLAALGCLASMLAVNPWQFILARGLAGAGYGLIILPPQAGAVKEGRLAFLFAGVYAGSLCGGALGAMLADSLGYAPVFGVSALLLFALAILPLLLFGRGRDKAASSPAACPLPSPASSPSRPGTPAQWRQICSLAADPAFLALALLSLLPASFLAVGLLNFFMPILLHDAGVTQSDIGRIFMLYCLIIIYVGPRVEKIWDAPQHKPRLVFWGGAAGAAAIGSFALLPAPSASLCAAVFLGLATCCNLPGQSGCLLRLRLAQRLGAEVSMGILNTLERIGQMLGPLCVGALLAALSVQVLSLWA